MNKQAINIVWIKRDIRSQDHEPLQVATLDKLPYIIVYLFEPSLMAYPDCSLRHLQFQYHSILSFNAASVQTENNRIVVTHTRNKPLKKKVGVKKDLLHEKK